MLDLLRGDLGSGDLVLSCELRFRMRFYDLTTIFPLLRPAEADAPMAAAFC